MLIALKRRVITVAETCVLHGDSESRQRQLERRPLQIGWCLYCEAGLRLGEFRACA